MTAADAQTSSLPLAGHPELPTALPPTLAQRLWRWGLPAVAVGVVLAALLGALAAQRQAATQAEVALETARLARYLGLLAQLSDAQALAVLSQGEALRHMALRVHDADQRVLLDRGEPTSATSPSVAWTVPRSDGRPWTVTLTPVASQHWQHEVAMAAGAAAALGVLLAGVLAVFALALRGAARHLQDLQDAVRAVPRLGLASLARLPVQPLGEIEGLAAALRQMAAGLQRREGLREQRLRHALMARERELQGLARVLHEGAGEPLSALRLDLTWLRRRLHSHPEFLQVLDQASAHGAGTQRLLRDLALALDPLALRSVAEAADAADAADGAASPSRHSPRATVRLAESLLALCDRFSRGGHQPLQCWVTCELDEQLSTRLHAPLQLALLRLTECAMQLAAEDGAATRAAVTLRADAAAGVLLWTAQDDGQGCLAAALQHPPQDNSAADLLARLHVTAWAWGAELEHHSEPQGRGRQLAVRLPLAEARAR
jgi:hypothetical protein